MNKTMAKVVKKVYLFNKKINANKIKSNINKK